MSNDISLPHRLRASPSVLCTVMSDGSFVLMDVNSGVFYQLGGVAARLWSLWQDDATVMPGLETILDEYGVEREELIRDVQELLRDLLAQNLIIVSDI